VIAKPLTPPTVQQQFVQCALVASTCFVWRGTWYFWDLVVGLGIGGALGSLFVGVVVIILTRWCPKTSDLCPPSEGIGLKDKSARMLFHVAVAAGVCLYWRGWWSIADNIIGKLLPAMVDCIVSFFIGCLGLIVINCSHLGKLGILDYTTLAAG
jgi:hypothetical protein